VAAVFGRVVVVGNSFAGLLTARALADHANGRPDAGERSDGSARRS
jgi:hypothetical protein